MTVTENIQQYVQKLPTSLQMEVLDFIKYLLFKKEQEILSNQDDSVWSNLSLELAMQGMEEDEGLPVYTREDLQEAFS